jgi:Skp family chaperone for outer membrane proteins
MRWKSLLTVFVVSMAWAVPAHAASKVAVVNIVKAMQAHPRTTAVEETFRAARQAAEKTLGTEEQAAKDLQAELDQMQAKHPDRPYKEKVYELKLNTLRFNYEWSMKSAVKAYVQGLERVYAAARGEIGRYAREQGIQIVLQRTEASQPLNAVDPKDFALKTRLRVVLYADKQVDITDAVVARLKASK